MLPLVSALFRWLRCRGLARRDAVGEKVAGLDIMQNVTPWLQLNTVCHIKMVHILQSRKKLDAASESPHKTDIS
eukprot:scaffold6583_cov108-Skeletonema_dohrnii-CCMP3373.AAC.2